MNEVNRTLYIPLYGKAMVSGQGMILEDPTAEAIWRQSGITLKGKAASKWLAYYLSMRARVFDDWLRAQQQRCPEAVVVHIGCGLDSRVRRVGCRTGWWYDVDLPAVIAQRKRYFAPSDHYTMLAADATQPQWVADLRDSACAIVVMEGLSMYLETQQLRQLLRALRGKYPQVHILMDVYTPLAARASRYKNPINTVGVTQVYGVKNPQDLLSPGLTFTREHTMTPENLVIQLKGGQRRFFQALFAGRMAGMFYRLLEYCTAE